MDTDIDSLLDILLIEKQAEMFTQKLLHVASSQAAIYQAGIAKDENMRLKWESISAYHMIKAHELCAQLGIIP